MYIMNVITRYHARVFHCLSKGRPNFKTVSLNWCILVKFILVIRVRRVLNEIGDW